MSEKNFGVSVAKALAIDVVGDVAYFPVWWYTVGLATTAKQVWNGLRQTAENLSLRLLFLNILKPMFGQYDRAGRIISFFMRIVILIWRLFRFIVLALVEIVYLLIWVLLPPFTIYRILQIYF